MNKTIKINLGGTLFQIDEEAYKILRGYLQDITNRLRNTPGAAETVEDIEQRISEIFQSQGASAGIISQENVETMMGIIGKPEDMDTGSEEYYTKDQTYHSTVPKKLYRNPDDQIISGVCGGLGAYLNMEPVWVRLLFIIFALTFGIGFFVYLALWIALPTASADHQKREMYGRDDYMSFRQKHERSSSGVSTGSASSGSPVGNAFNEVFRAIGQVLFIIVRIILIIVGIGLVLAGFFTLVAFVMVFFLKYPGYFSTHSYAINLFYFPDFINYIVDPAIAPWIMVLGSVVILLPLFALIYWGVKMIFWFRAKDGIISLAALVIWVMSVAALSILLFNEGISFAERVKISTEKVIKKAPDDLYIMAGNKLSDLNYDKDISFDENDYRVFFTDNNKGLFINTKLNFDISEDSNIRMNIKKSSAGRSRVDAQKKAEDLIYNYRVSGDTIYLDEYFSIPSGSKWSVDDVRINLLIPQGTRIHFDKTTEDMFRNRYYEHNGWEEFEEQGTSEQSENNDNNIWIMTENGLRQNSPRE